MTKLKISEEVLQQIIKEELAYLEERKKLNEGILDVLGGIFGSGINALIDRLKARIARYFLERAGIDTNGALGRVLVNVFENLEVSEVWDIITKEEDRCPKIASEILEAIAETMLEDLPGVLGFQPRGWFGTNVYTTVREMATNALIRNNQTIRRVSELLCNIDSDDIMRDAGASSQQVAAIQGMERAGAFEGNNLTSTNEVMNESIAYARHQIRRQLRRKKK